MMEVIPDTLDQGAAYVFVPGEIGVWLLQQELLAPDGAAGDHFGVSVGLQGDTAAVGADMNALGGNLNQGSVDVFMRFSSAWVDVSTYYSLQTGAGDRFGYSVAVSGDTVLAGAPFNDLRNTDAGVAFFLYPSRGGQTDLGVTAAVNPSSPFTKNQLVNLSATVANLGIVSADYVLLSVPIPAGFTYTFSTVTQGSYDPATGSWSVGTLAVGANATLEITAKVTSAPGKTVYFTPTILAQDNNAMNDQASLPLKIYKLISKNGSFEAYSGTSLIPTNWQAVLFTGSDGKDTSVFQHAATSVRICEHDRGYQDPDPNADPERGIRR